MRGKYQNSGPNPPHYHRRPGGGNWEDEWEGGEEEDREVKDSREMRRR